MVTLSTTDIGLSTPSPVSETPVAEVDPDLALLDINLRNLRVPKVGGTHEDTSRVVPVYVYDPDGNEVLWVTRVLNVLRSKRKSVDTCNAYAKSFYRAAVVMWALGLDPEKLTEIQWAVVRGWLRECMRRSGPVADDFAKPYAPSTVAGTETALKAIYKQGLRLGLVTSNPIADLEDLDDDDLSNHFGKQTYDTSAVRSERAWRTKVPEKEIKTVPEAMQPLIRDARQPRDRALFTFCLDTGPRISEALSLTLQHYYPHEHRAMLVGKGMDGGRRTVPLTDGTIEKIENYLSWLDRKGLRLLPHEPVFRSVKTPYDPLQYDGAWAALRRRLGNVGFHPHALRHTAATDTLRLLDNPEGKGLETVRLMLGHANVATTSRYLHLQPSEVIAAVVSARNRPRRALPELSAMYTPDAQAMLAEILNEVEP